jgi:uncharacterized delta-60 repeat protein
MGGVLLAWLGVVAPALAAEGDLDPSFGNGGRVATTVGSQPSERAIAIDAQGRILVVGAVRINDDDGDMLVARYLPTGALDPAFSGDGIATFDFPAADDFDNASAVTVDAGGGILVAGTTDSADLGLIRVSSDGTLDAGFGAPGSNGYVKRDFFGGAELAGAIAVDSAGRILVGGSTVNGGDFDFVVSRYDSGGNPDMSFGSGGLRTVDFTSGANDQDLARGMTLDAQGRILLAGYSQTGATPASSDFALARLTSDGSRDASFGPNTDPFHTGQVTTPIGATGDQAVGIAVDADGKIVVAGDAEIGPREQFALARYNPDGSLDTTFSDDGKLTTVIDGGAGAGDAGAETVGIDWYGRIVAVGSAVNAAGGEDFALARYQPNGSLDPTFGGDGTVTAPNGEDGRAVFDDHRRIVVAGLFTPGGGAQSQFGLARFIGDATAPTASIVSGPADGALINDPTPTFEFSSTESGGTFSCGFDGFTSACPTPFTATVPLGDGPHTLSLSAIDRAGNTSAPQVRSFTVDTVAPEIDIKAKKKVKTRRKKVRGKLKISTSEPVELTCTVDKRKPEECVKKFITPKLKKGKHKVTVEATDRAGNSSTEAKKLKVVRKP